jgi:hypothetical protein
MKKFRGAIPALTMAAAMVAGGAPVWASARGAASAGGGWLEPAESVRLTKAKDLISEDRWVAAIAELRAAVADPKEQSRDEALFWLAHSQNQVGDLAEAVESIRRLQRDHARSRWSAPAYSLLIELAQKLGRNDVLWRLAPSTPAAPPAPASVPVRSGRRTPRTVTPAPPPAPPTPGATGAAAPPAPPDPPALWVSETYSPDADLRIQALGRLIRTDAKKVIPLLGNIALERTNPGAARRAVFVLAESGHPEARLMVVDVAKKGPEPVRVAAVRELGRFGGPTVSKDLLQVYSTANVPVKQQVVISLGLRAETQALMTIARSEHNPDVRDTAVIALGRAGGHEQLREMYAGASADLRRAIVRGLFTARDDDGLIRIAEQEKEPGLKRYVHERLRLMGTPRARGYLESAK